MQNRNKHRHSLSHQDLSVVTWYWRQKETFLPPWSGLIGQAGWSEGAMGSDHLKIPLLFIKNLSSPNLIDVFLS